MSDNFLKMTDEQKSQLKIAGIAGASVGSVAAYSSAQPAHADGVADLVAGVTSLDGIVDAVVPIAVTVIIFTSAAMVLRRLIMA